MVKNQDIKERKLIDIVIEMENNRGGEEFYPLLNKLNGLEISEKLKSYLKSRMGGRSYVYNIGHLEHTAYGGIKAAYDALFFELEEWNLENALEVAEKGWDKNPGYGWFGGSIGYRKLYPEVAFKFDKELLRNLFTKSPKGKLNKLNFLEMYIYPDYVQHMNSGNMKKRRERKEEFNAIRLERKNILNKLGVKEPLLPKYKSRKHYIKLYWD